MKTRAVLTSITENMLDFQTKTQKETKKYVKQTLVKKYIQRKNFLKILNKSF